MLQALLLLPRAEWLESDLMSAPVLCICVYCTVGLPVLQASCFSVSGEVQSKQPPMRLQQRVLQLQLLLLLQVLLQRPRRLPNSARDPFLVHRYKYKPSLAAYALSASPIRRHGQQLQQQRQQRHGVQQQHPSASSCCCCRPRGQARARGMGEDLERIASWFALAYDGRVLLLRTRNDRRIE